MIQVKLILLAIIIYWNLISWQSYCRRRTSIASALFFIAWRLQEKAEWRIKLQIYIRCTNNLCANVIVTVKTVQMLQKRAGLVSIVRSLCCLQVKMGVGWKTHNLLDFFNTFGQNAGLSEGPTVIASTFGVIRTELYCCQTSQAQPIAEISYIYLFTCSARENKTVILPITPD